MIRNLLTLVAHDLAVAFKNKTLLLMVCIPLFVFATLQLLDRADAPASAVRLGLLEREPYAPALRKNLLSAPDAFSLREVADLEEGTRSLKEREIDGLLLNARDDPSRLVVLVAKKESLATWTLVQRFTALQIATEGTGTNWISALRPLQSGSIEVQSLPIWILLVVLLVSFFVLPTQVAEEKEKQWLLGLLQTPMRESEWLLAKLVYGLILMLAAVFALHLFAASPCMGWNYLALLAAGGFSFGALGLLLGLLCRSQASARTFGILCYLPLLLPAALADQSQELRAIAPLLPSYAFYEPLQSLLLDQTGGIFSIQLLVLVSMGAAACLLSHRLIRIRWLM